MNKPLSCGAQDMLEAVIVQKRRINLVYGVENGEQIKHSKVLPIDIGSEQGQEHLTFMTTDNQGGIIKLSISTDEIISFEANDFKDPRIQFNRADNSSCETKF